MIAYALRLEFNINNVVFGATFEFSALLPIKRCRYTEECMYVHKVSLVLRNC